jgi:hypothetical protein
MEVMNVTTHAVPAFAAAKRALSQWVWLGIALFVGFAIPFVFADLLAIERDVYVGIYAAATLALFAAWLRFSGKALGSLVRHRWPLAIALGALGAVATGLAVLRVEDPTPHPDGFEFAVAVVWRGIVYGLVDGLLLAALPVLIVYAALEPGRRPLLGKLAIGLAAVVASLAMTTAYHLGYPEFRDGDVAKPLSGNAAWSLPTVLSANPIASPIAHAGMHVTAVLESYETDVFLPPHQSKEE